MTPGETTTGAVASYPALESVPAVTPQLPLCRGLDAPGAGALICTARRRLAAGASLLSCVLLASTCADHSWILGCVHQRLGLQGLRHGWSDTPGAAQPPHVEPPPEGVAPRAPPGAPSSPLGSSAHSVWRALHQGAGTVPLSDPGSLRASLPFLGSCPSSLPAPFHPERLVKFLLLRDWAFLSWELSHRPALARLLEVGGPPPWMLFY